MSEWSHLAGFLDFGKTSENRPIVSKKVKVISLCFITHPYCARFVVSLFRARSRRAHGALTARSRPGRHGFQLRLGLRPH